MGLDIYILRARKPKKIKEGTLFNSSDLYREDILFESMDKENLDLINELIPYGIRVKVKQEYVNKEGVLKYLGISSCRYAYIDVGNKITVCDDDYKEYTIPPEEAGKYIYTQDDDFLACEVDRVAYWRSNHDVSDFFYENIMIIQKSQMHGVSISGQELLTVMIWNPFFLCRQKSIFNAVEFIYLAMIFSFSG